MESSEQSLSDKQTISTFETTTVEATYIKQRRISQIKFFPTKCKCNMDHCICSMVETFRKVATSPNERKGLLIQEDHVCKEHQGFDKYCSNCQKLLYAKFLGDPPPSKPPLQTAGEVIVDNQITRLAKPKDPVLRKLQWMKRKKYRHAGTSCERIIGGLDRGYDPEFKSEIPIIKKMCPHISIRRLAKFLNVHNYKSNYISFWMLDVLCLAIQRCQLRGVTEKNQKTFILWFTYIWKTIQFTSSTRNEIFDDLDKMLVKAGQYMEKIETNAIPSPGFVKFMGSIDDLNASELLHITAIYIKKKNKSINYEESDESKLENNETSTAVTTVASLSEINSEPIFLDENERIEHSSNVLNDLIVTADQLYYIFAENSTFKLLASLVRHPRSIEYWPITRRLKRPKKVRSLPCHLMTTTECDYIDSHLNRMDEKKQEIIETLQDLNEELRPDTSEIVVKEGTDDLMLEMPKDNDELVDTEKQEYMEKLQQLPDFGTDRSVYDPDPLRQCDRVQWNKTLLPLHQAVPIGFLETFKPEAKVESLIKSGDPTLLNMVMHKPLKGESSKIKFRRFKKVSDLLKKEEKELRKQLELEEGGQVESQSKEKKNKRKKSVRATDEDEQNEDKPKKKTEAKSVRETKKTTKNTKSVLRKGTMAAEESETEVKQSLNKKSKKKTKK